MKKLLIALILLLLPLTSYAIDLQGYAFVDIPFGIENWTRAIDGSWHIDRGMVLGFKSIYTPFLGMNITLSDGLIMDSVAPYIQNIGVGIGPVGNCIDTSVKIFDPSWNSSIRLNYLLKWWWVKDNYYGYEYLVPGNGIVQNLRVTVEVRLF